MFQELRIAAYMEALYQDYCYQIRNSLICPPNNRRWLAGVIRKGITGSDGSPVWVKDMHPTLYADLA